MEQTKKEIQLKRKKKDKRDRERERGYTVVFCKPANLKPKACRRTTGRDFSWRRFWGATWLVHGWLVHV